MKYLAIDYGSKKIGIAVSDDTGTLAFARGVISNDDMVVPFILDMMRGEDVGEIVIGHSLSSSGEENAIMGQVYELVEALKAVTETPIQLVNEFGTTAAALAAHDFTAGTPRNQASPRRKETKGKAVDDHAAAILLQRYLDRAQ